MKFPLRIYGEVMGLDPEKLSDLRGLLNADLFFPRDAGRMEVEYEGAYLDVEPELDMLVAALAKDGQGYVDCIDHENWTVRRYKLQPGSWTCREVDPNSSLERYHHE